MKVQHKAQPVELGLSQSIIAVAALAGIDRVPLHVACPLVADRGAAVIVSCRKAADSTATQPGCGSIAPLGVALGPTTITSQLATARDPCLSRSG